MYKRIPVFFCKKCEFSKNTFGKWTVYIIIGVLVYSIVFQTLTAGLAVWGYNETIPGIIIDGKNLSTAFMRKWVYEPSWEAMNGPCVVYMTLPEDASTGVFVNFLVNLKSWPKEKWDISVEYLQITDQIIEDWNDPTLAWSSKKPTKSTYHVPDYEYHKKNVYSAYINGLSSNSTLVFKIIDKSWNNPTIYSYKVVNPERMIFVAGGDVGNTELAKFINKNVVSRVDSDLIMIGGDIVYDNNTPTCYRAWDYFLK